ncbi:phenazine biosynthesis protein PhzF [Embleya scabrispora]|uniref:Phenazine biosynthesis protein PhzF n=1 Tax=Embleya scabrispora TaxID=159449 RepID=A0A1T3NK05_9ACTN|nr:PhzF family phenazine biosynthesis protein [Embleya scabrispora]OPC77104.1 phenazine biosynthesis protein PhzF [Embleya scabrispora]
MAPPSVGYHHVDVFAELPYTGNSLAVFVDPPTLSVDRMLRITRELRHFESIFVGRRTDNVIHARVFDLIEELGFAGHPVMGAAAVLHLRSAVASGEELRWTFELPARTVRVTTSGDDAGRVFALLDQGRPELVARADAIDRVAVAASLGLSPDELREDLPTEVHSTGLRYLIVPVRDADVLGRAHIRRADFDAFLAALGAEFVYVLDVDSLQGRHWNNDGVREDVATGSAAGCVAAYLMRHGHACHGRPSALGQGRFVGRPSTITITAYGRPDEVERVIVGGTVTPVGTGTLHALPAEGRP